MFTLWVARTYLSPATCGLFSFSPSAWCVGFPTNADVLVRCRNLVFSLSIARLKLDPLSGGLKAPSRRSRAASSTGPKGGAARPTLRLLVRGSTMIHIWRASFGTWVIRPAAMGYGFVLVWYDSNNRPSYSAHFTEAQQAVDATYRKRTGLR